MCASPQKENGYTPIANEILEHLAKIRINGEARQMLDVIIRKTYGFNKKQDRISTSQFVEATGLPAYAIHKARFKLLQMKIIEVLPKKVIGVTQKGNSQILTYCFQKDYLKWQPLPKKVTITQKGNTLSPKKVTNYNPKSDTQKKERKYTKENIYGEFKNVFLTNEEYLKLNQLFGEQNTSSYINNLSYYMQSKGKKYKSHYATILNWNREKKQISPKKINKNPFIQCPICKKETTQQDVDNIGSCPNCIPPINPEKIKEFVDKLNKSIK